MDTSASYSLNLGCVLLLCHMTRVGLPDLHNKQNRVEKIEDRRKLRKKEGWCEQNIKEGGRNVRTWFGLRAPSLLSLPVFSS